MSACGPEGITSIMGKAFVKSLRQWKGQTNLNDRTSLPSPESWSTYWPEAVSVKSSLTA